LLDRTTETARNTAGNAIGDASGEPQARVRRNWFTALPGKIAGIYSERGIRGVLRRAWQFFVGQSFSSLTRRIVFLNVAGLLALVLGILYLSQFRAGLIDSAKERLVVQGEIIAGAIASSATAEQDTITFDLERQVRQLENLISILVGRNPGEVLRGRAVTEQKRPGTVPAGLPSELLDRRPDVRVAEQDLAAATANIGQAKALLFPRIALTGSFGFTSTEFDTWFDGPSKAWNILGNLLQPIFNAGKNRRRVEITESQQRQTLYEYERTILQAFRETEDALVAYRKTGEQRVAQAQRVTAERKVLELAELRYRGGVAAYLEVLDAQRSLFGAEIDETQTIAANLVSLVQLYKALGGGWPGAPEAGSSTTPPPSPAP